MARGRCKPRNASRAFFSSRAHHLRMCRHSCCVQHKPTVVLVAQRGAVNIWRAGLLVTPIGHRLPVRFDSESCTKVRQDENEGGTEDPSEMQPMCPLYAPSAHKYSRMWMAVSRHIKVKHQIGSEARGGRPVSAAWALYMTASREHTRLL